MIKISRHQLYCLMLIGQVGTTNLWAFCTDAKRDAWISTLLSMLGGFALAWIFLKLHQNSPNGNIAAIAVAALGKAVGTPLAVLYALLFLFNFTRVSSESADLIAMTFLQRTPHPVIIFLFIFSVLIMLFFGIEVIARLSEIVFPLLLVLILSVYALICLSGRVDLKELTPVLENGIAPVLSATFPVCVNFPFGMIFLFLQIWPYYDAKQDIPKSVFLSLLVSGVLLTATQVVDIATLGVELTKNATIPFFEVIKLIDIGDILTNLDVVGVILIFISGFFLALFYLFSAATVLSTVCRGISYRWFLIPAGVFTFWYAGVYEPSYPAHVQFLTPQFWQQFVPAFDLIPLFLLAIVGLKSYCARQKTHGAS